MVLMVSLRLVTHNKITVLLWFLFNFRFRCIVHNSLSFPVPNFFHVIASLFSSRPFIVSNLFETSFDLGVSDEFDDASKLL